MPAYAVQGAQWLPSYVMPAAPMQQVDDGYNLAASHIGATYKSEGQGPRGVSLMLPSPDPTAAYNMIPQVRIAWYKFTNHV